MKPTNFQKEIWSYYKKNKRDFPWRNTKNPYHILVSEIMLQQTQTERVVPKYKAFLKQFPTWKALAKAPTAKVLIAWQGLGYNRRALNLQRAAQTVVKEFKNKFPKTLDEIVSLPGIGPYTAGALLAFAYDLPSPFIETNIRRVYLHFFFKDQASIHDKEILNVIEKTLPERNFGEWYYALMDYGVYLKKLHGKTNINHKSLHYQKQSPFKGSHREKRSKLLRMILKKEIIPQTKANRSVLKELAKEGFF